LRALGAHLGGGGGGMSIGGGTSTSGSTLACAPSVAPTSAGGSSGGVSPDMYYPPALGRPYTGAVIGLGWMGMLCECARGRVHGTATSARQQLLGCADVGTNPNTLSLVAACR
jgi:hypothetical protein